MLNGHLKFSAIFRAGHDYLDSCLYIVRQVELLSV